MLTPSDKAALEFGRMWMRANVAEQKVAELTARLAEFETKKRESSEAEAQEAKTG